jgi:DNA-binding NarL/FixJ family response regulator
MTSVVIADDQELVRSGLEMVLQVRGVDVVGQAADGRAAVEVVRRTRPDVVLMDIRMPVLDGVAATREITASELPTRVLVLTTYDLDAYVYGALQAGAAGFLLKATPPDRLVAGPTNRYQLALFQAAYCGPGGWLAIDGQFGPQTANALQWM